MASSAMLVLAALVACCLAARPEQLHIAVGGTSTVLNVNWATLEPTPTSAVVFGSTNTNTTRTAFGSQRAFVDGGSTKRTIYIHDAVLTGLQPGTRYWYYVGDAASGWSDEYEFETISEGIFAKTVAVFGDLGYLSPICFDALLKEAQNHTIVASVHLGDYAYDMNYEEGLLGDKYMNQIQPLVARIPYMAVIGNHESAYNYSHFTERFSNMPYRESGSPVNWFYSYNIGAVHFISASTEVFFQNTELAKVQYQWMEADLQKAVQNRDLIPFIVVLGHRSLYCSNVDKDTLMLKGDCQGDAERVRNGIDGQFGLEALSQKYQVDLFFTAHQHSYERTLPVYQNEVLGSYDEPRAPVHIITGAAGNDEGLEIFNGSQGHQWSVMRLSDYGYGRLTPIDAKTLLFEQVGPNGQIQDRVQITKRNQ